MTQQKALLKNPANIDCSHTGLAGLPANTIRTVMDSVSSDPKNSAFESFMFLSVGDSVQRTAVRSTQSSGESFTVSWASSQFRAAAVLAGHCLQPYVYTDALGRVPLREPPGCFRTSGTSTSLVRLPAAAGWGPRGAYLAEFHGHSSTG